MKQFLILLVALSLGACGFLQERPTTARIAVNYATLKIIDEDLNKAVRVVEIAEEVKEYASADAEVTVAALIRETTRLIRFDKLDRADTILVQSLLLELQARLTEVLGEGPLPEDARVTVETVADWVIETATLIQ